MNKFTSIPNLHNSYLKCSGVSIDSRTINQGEMFFALCGHNFDGHKYLENAKEGGAKYVVIDNPEYLLDTSNTILVPNVENALQDVARYHRASLSIPVIGLTGSNGKTTTKELISASLSEHFDVFATKGNYNNHLGVPISILGIQNHHEIAIIEMGANNPKEIEFLSEIAMPDYGLITNIGKAHLEGFGDIEGVRKAKTELYDYIRKVDGTIFYNTKDNYLTSSITDSDNTVAYDPSQMKIENEFPLLKIIYKGNTYKTGLSGGYNAINMLAAITIGKYFNVPSDKIIRGLQKYSSSNNRSEIKKTLKNQLILDAYNANPSSMKVSIENIAKAEISNKVLIIGHMLELGKESLAEHQLLINYIDQHVWEKVIIIGHEFEKTKFTHKFSYFDNTSQAITYLKENPIENCNILLKGSRGVALEKLIPFL